MRFVETKLRGVYLLDPVRHADERGSFARTWCEREAAEHGLEPRVVQCNVSYNREAGTLRGMHFQVEPFMEAKTVSCLKGSIYDVAVDLRRDSPTYGQYEAVRLTSSLRQAFHIPKGFAHGFLTLEPETEVLYLMSEFYQPDSARGFRWDDPRFAIAWPGPPAVMSDRDRNYPDFLDT